MKMTNIMKLMPVLLVVSVLILSGCGNEAETKAEKKEAYTLVEVKELESVSYTDYLDVLGTVKAFKQSNLAAPGGGKIERFYKDKGDYVKRGGAIVELENDALKAQMESAKSEYDLAQINFEKQEKVYKDSVTSELQYLESKYRRDGAKARYELVKSQYENTFITAPFSGYVDARMYEVGEVAPPGAVIVTLINSSRVKVEAGVPENYLNDVKMNTPVKVIFRDLGGEVYWSEISYIGRSISTNNRTFPIEVYLKNSNNRLKPELNAELYIKREAFDSVVMVPEDVIVKTDKGNIAFVYNNGKAEQRIVEIAGRENNSVAVSEGLYAGDKLIIVGYQSLVDGENVKINE